MRMQNNIPAMNIYRNFKKVSVDKSKKSKNLSSGHRINSAADDASGLAISEKMRAQIQGLSMAAKNTLDAISLFQTAEGAVSEIGSMLHRIRELAVQACNDTNTFEDRQKMNEEVQHLLQETDELSKKTEFNNIKVLAPEVWQAVTQTETGTQTVTLNGRRSAYGLENNPAGQDQLQNADFNSGIFIGMSIYNKDSSLSQMVYIDLGAAVLDYDSSFESFVQSGLYEADGTITDANMKRFADALQNGLMSELKLHEDEGWVIGDVGSQYVVVDFDDDRHLYIGYSNDTYSINNIRMFDPISAFDFGSDFFLGLMGDNAYSHYSEYASSWHTITKSDDTQKQQWLQNDTNAMWFQNGANATLGTLFTWDSVSVEQLGLINASVLTHQKATDSLEKVDLALDSVNNLRAKFGAYINRLEHTIRNLDVSVVNLSAAESRIRDADMAKEMIDLVRTNTLEQVGITFLTQANHNNEMVLQLLR